MKNEIKLLITGGAGFIGSNLVEKYVNDPRISLVRVVDDLSNGYFSNIEPFINHPKFEFLKGDISDYEVCLKATKNIDKVTHQAALGSVPRSIQNPMRSTEVNVLGTVNLMYACHVNQVERIVLACSSSTYGDSQALPKVEEYIGRPLSPYAVTKLAVELYAEVFYKTYGLNFIGLRYFNVFGPKQNADNPYAAVIPIFCKAFLEEGIITINGDGETSRDFTFVENTLMANDLALFTTDERALNQVYNVACGAQTTLNEMINILSLYTSKKIVVNYGQERKGDVRHSKADISKIKNILNFAVKCEFEEGLKRVYDWYSTQES